MNCWYNDVQRVLIQHLLGVQKSPWSLTLQMIISRAYFVNENIWLVTHFLVNTILWSFINGFNQMWHWFIYNGLEPNIDFYRNKWMCVLRSMHAALGQHCKKHNLGWGVLNIHSLISPQRKSVKSSKYHLYLTGVTKAQRWWHPSNINVISTVRWMGGTVLW